MVKDFKDLEAWKTAMEMARKVYQVTQLFPREERFGLTQQIQRAAVSVASCIAEGSERDTTRGYLHFLSIARGSAAEVECQIILAGDLGYVEPEEVETVLRLATSTKKLVNGLRRALKKRLGTRDELDDFGAGEVGDVDVD